MADLARDRLRLDRLEPQRLRSNFFPLRWRAFLARQKSVPSGVLRCASSGAASIVSGPSIAIEAAVVAGSKTAKRRSNMANIGSFKKVGNEFHGEIVTLAVQAKGVRIVPEANRANDNAPSHRVFVGRVEIGAAWARRSEETGRDYHSMKFDDPSFTAPIYANLFEDEEGGESYSLIWSRPRSKSAD
jgi:uncharacterized protein (DUF736 family)